MTILLVDDDELVVYLASELLRRDGHDVLTASRGQDALAILEKRPVDILVTNGLMPDLTGPELIRAARDRGFDGGTVFLSSFWKDAKSEDIGADVILRKPIDLKTFSSVVASAHREGLA